MSRFKSKRTPEQRERINTLRVRITELTKDHAEATVRYEQARIHREGTLLALKDARAQLTQALYTPEELVERRAHMERQRPKLNLRFQHVREAAGALVLTDPSQPAQFVPPKALEPAPWPMGNGGLFDESPRGKEQPSPKPEQFPRSNKPERSTDQLTCTQCGGTITPRGLCKCPGVRHRAARKIEPGPRVTLRHDAIKPYDMSQHRE